MKSVYYGLALFLFQKVLLQHGYAIGWNYFIGSITLSRKKVKQNAIFAKSNTSNGFSHFALALYVVGENTNNCDKHFSYCNNGFYRCK